jgi:DNA-binding beta-propeller fold protein YncE
VQSGFLAVDAGYNMYVVGRLPGDAAHVGLLKVSPQGQVLAHWGRFSAGADSNIQGIALSRAGNIYMGDGARTQIAELSPSFHLIRRWGGFGPKPGSFAYIEGIAVGVRDHVYVGDCVPHGAPGSPLNNERLDEFTATGQLVRVLTGQKAGRSLVDAFDCVVGVATDRKGDVYAVDHRNERLVEFSPAGTWKRTIDLLAQATSTPEGLAVDPAGRWAYVTVGGDIQQYSLTNGAFVREWNLSPWGVFSPAVDPHGAVYADEGQLYAPQVHDRLVRFSPGGKTLATWTSS